MAAAPAAGWPLRSACLAMLALLGACASTPQPVVDAAAAAAPVASPAPVAPAPPPATQSAGATPAPLTTVVAAGDAGPIALDPLQPTVRVDLDSAAANTDLWVRVRNGFGMPDLDNDLVRKWEQWYAARPDYVQRMTERGGRYLFHTVEEMSRRGLPTELALLPFIESAYNPQAMSTAKASGMWQFIPGTGRDFALKQNIFRDDRRDVLASTRAAADYLTSLHGMFGDWHLALAAYNWGQGSVQRAIGRNQKAGLGTGYTELSMPDETRNYVPKLQAIKNIVSRPEQFGLALMPLKNHPYFISVAIDRDIDVDRAVRLAGLSMDEFRALNPQMNKPVILAAGTPQLLMPYDNANRFVRAVAQHKAPLASWTAWVAPKTMKLSLVAQQVGMDEAEIRRVNNIPPRMLVKAGSTLLVTRHDQRQADVQEAVADNAALALAPEPPPFRRVSFKAGRKGETVAAVARRYRISPVAVAQWNHTAPGARFRPGQVVVLNLPVTARAVLAQADTADKRAPVVRAAQAGKRTAAASPAKGRAARATVVAKAPAAARAPVQRTVAARKLVKPEAAARSRQR